MRVLTRMWQMLLKALEEVALAPNAMMAAEMAIIRLTHVADLPDPETLVRRLQSQPPAPMPPTGGAPAGNGGGGRMAPAPGRLSGPATSGPTMSGPSMSGAATATALAPASEQALSRFGAFPDVVELIRANRDVKLLIEVETTLRLARYSPGRIEFEPTHDAPKDLAARLAQRLQGWTGARWAVTLVPEGGAPTIAEVRDADRLAAEAEALENPMVQGGLRRLPEGPDNRDPNPRSPRPGSRQPGAARGRGRMGPVRRQLTGDSDAQRSGRPWRHGQDDEGRAGHAGQDGGAATMRCRALS